MRRLLLAVIAVILLSVAGLGGLSVLSRRTPEGLGVADGQLAACPETPNCVSTRAVDDRQRMEPIPFEGTGDEAIRLVAAALAALPRTRIVEQSGQYIRAEAASAIFRFVDDVEFLADPADRVIHFRSASRVGHSDLGANRRRMDFLRESLGR